MADTQNFDPIQNTGGPNVPPSPSAPTPPPQDPLLAAMQASAQMRAQKGKTSAGPQEGLFTGGYTPLGEFSDQGRYPVYFQGLDNEDMYGKGQTFWNKFTRSTAQLVGLAGTTALEGTIGTIYGIAQMISTGKLSSFYNNEFNNKMDDFNKGLAESHALYYTNAEKNAEHWYSPESLFTANFLLDKVYKNLGFAAGAALGGMGWGKALGLLGKISRVTSAGGLAEAAAVSENIASTANAAQRMGKMESALTKIAEKFASNYNTLNTAQRVTTAGLMTFGEASIEALGGLNAYREKEISDYFAKHGVMPDAEAMKKINEGAENIGNAQLGANVALLSATNYIQLPKILGSSYKLEKSIINNASRQIDDITRTAEGVYEAVKPTTKAGRLYQRAKGVGQYLFAPSEAFEEAGQYAIEQGAENYYRKGEKATVFDDFFGYGIKQAVTTKEGIESALIGGLSGAIMTARGTYKQNKQTKADTASAIQSFNDTYKGSYMKEMVEGYARAQAVQGERDAALKQGDFLTAKNKEYDFMHSYLAPRIKFGRFDLVNEELDSIAADLQTEKGRAILKERGFIDDKTDVDAYLQNLNKMKQAAKGIKTAYETLNVRYGGLKKEDGTPAYPQPVIDQMVYANAVIQDFDRRIPLLHSTLQAQGVSTIKAMDEITKTGKVSEETQAEVMAQIDAINGTADDKKAALDTFNDAMELSLQRKDYIKQYDNMKANPEKYSKEIPVPGTATTADGKTVAKGDLPKVKHTVTTADGEEDFNDDEELMVMVKTESPDEMQKHFDFPTFKITKRNEDGTMEITASNGAKKTVPANYLSKYKVGRVKDVAKNKAAAYFIRHANKVTKFNFGKKSAARILGVTEASLKDGYVNGRIWYDGETKMIHFYYKDSKGKTHNFPLQTQHFLTQEGFLAPQFQITGEEVTKYDPEIIEALKKQKLEGKLAARFAMINKFVTDSKKRTEQINEDIKDRQARIARLDKIVEDISKTKKGVPRKKITKALANTIQQLGKVKAETLFEIEQLEQEQFELEQVLPYYEDLLHNAKELPEVTPDIVTNLKDDIEQLSKLIDTNTNLIATNNDILDIVNDALKEAYKKLNSFIEDIRRKNNMLPPSIAQYQAQLERYMGEEGARQFIENSEGFAPLVKAMEAEIAEYSEFLELPDLTMDLDTLNKGITEWSDNVDTLAKEYQAKLRILEFFEGEINRVKKEKELQDQLAKDLVIWEKLFKAQGTADAAEVPTDINEAELTKAYQGDKGSPLKSPTMLVSGSVITSREYDAAFEQKPYLVNEEKFLNALGAGLLGNPSDFSAFAVHQGNEKNLGLEGLVDYRSGDYLKASNLDPMDVDRGIIIYVYVRKTDKGFEFVNREGEPIGKVGEKIDVTKVITSMAPSTATKDAQDKPRYREVPGVDANKAMAAWKNIRKGIFEKTGENLKAVVFQVKGTSRGTSQKNVEKVQDENGKVIKNEYPDKNIISEVLTTPEVLASKEQVIFVSTSPKVDIGDGASMNMPIGRPYFKKGSTVEFVNNRPLTEREGDVVFEVLVKLAEKFQKEKKLDTGLTDWLKSVVYWYSPHAGNPKPHPHQIYINNGTLHIGAQDIKVYFTPETLESNRALVIDAFLKGNLAGQGTFHHVSNKALKANEKYAEITGFDKEGNPEKRVWNTYQEYLTSPVYPDGSKRAEQPPITTNIRKPQSETDSSIRGRYAIFSMDLGDIGQPVQQAPEAAAISANDSDLSFMDYLQANINEANAAAQKGAASQQGKAPANPAPKQPSEEKGGSFMDYLAANIAEANGGQQAPSPSQAPKVEVKEEAPFTPTTEKVEKIGESVTLFDFSARLDAMLGGDDFSSQASTEYRRVEERYNNSQATPERWEKVEAWFKANLPQVPVQRVKHIITTTDGGRAWGKFSKAGIALYEGAIHGTGYHEGFEAVWGTFLTPEEQTELLKEFRNRDGVFYDTLTRKEIPYRNASMKQAKERLADEFIDYVDTGKTVAPKKAKGFFSQLWNFIKNIFAPQNISSVEEVFSKLNSGYYASMPFNQERVSGEEYRRIEGFDYEISHEVMQHVTSTIMSFFRNTPKRKKIFSLSELSDSQALPIDRMYDEVYKALRAQYLGLAQIARTEGNTQLLVKYVSLWENINNNWKSITKENNIYLKALGIAEMTLANEDDRLQATEKSELMDEGDDDITDDISHEEKMNSKNSVDYDRDIFTIDGKANASTAIRVLFNTIRDAEFKTIDAGLGSERVEVVPKKSSIDGALFINFSRAFNRTLSELSNTSNLQSMMKKLAKVAKEDAPIYDVLKALSINADTGEIDYSTLSYDDLRLIIDFYKTMSKQQPVSYRMNQRGDTSFMSPSTKFGEVENILTRFVRTIKSNDKFFKYDVENKVFNPVANAFNNFSLSDYKEKVRFLKAIGFGLDEKNDFMMSEAEFNKLSPKQKSAFSSATNNLFYYLQKQKAIFNVTTKSLQLQGQISALANVIVESKGDSFDSTFFNIVGERVQAYVLNNPYATFLNDVNEAQTKQELIDKQALGGGFSQGSVYMDEVLFDKNGKKTDEEITLGYIDGFQGKRTQQSARLTLRNRILQSFNLNLNGWYIPITNGDKKTDWMMKMKNIISFKTIDTPSTYQTIFRNYLKYEILTAIEDSSRPQINISADKKGKLRFFMDILKAQPALTKAIDNLIVKEGSEKNIDKWIADNTDKINTAVEEFIKAQIEGQRSNLKKYGLIKTTYGKKESDPITYSIEGLDQNFLFNEINSSGENSLTKEELEKTLKYRTVNALINNIEMFKLFFGDPAMYKDAFKRIPGATGGVVQTMHSNPEFNNTLNVLANNTDIKFGTGVALDSNDYGYTTFKENATILVYGDIIVKGGIDNGNYDEVNEADAQSKMTLPAYRQFKIRTAEWNDGQETQYQYEMALFRDRFGNKAKMSQALQDHDKALLEKGNPHTGVFEVIKPKGFSQNSSSQYRDIVYFKTSTAPLIPSAIAEGSNDEKLLKKMLDENIDFAATESALKVGIRSKAKFYTAEGNFNEEATNPDTILAPTWKDLGIQVETQFSQGKTKTTLGSQLTKLATLNLMSGGLPIDIKGMDFDAWNKLTETQKRKTSPIYNMIRKNTGILQELMNEGYESMLDTLGIVETKGANGEVTFNVPNHQKVVDFLLEQTRDMDDNTREALSVDTITQHLRTPLEAIPQYSQLKAVLYALVDKRIASPKTGGINLVQKSAWGREVGNRKAEKGKLIGNPSYKFYTKEEPWMEISVPAWFRDKLVDKYRRKGLPIPSEEELLNMVNTDLLRGIGFRIPTQELNSVEVFRIKSFLSPEEGNTVIVPAEITQKAGSDFDVDKLNSYLKNFTIDMKTKRIVKITSTLSRAEARTVFAEEFEQILKNQKESLEKGIEAVGRKFSMLQDFELGLLSEEQIDKYGELIEDIYSDLGDVTEGAPELMTKLENMGARQKKLNDADLQAALKEEFIKRQTRKSLENAYYESLEELVSLPENYERLIAINSAKQLMDIRNKLNTAKYTAEEIAAQNIEVGKKKPLAYGYLISPATLDEIRHNFITGKFGVGIAAIAQTTNALFQKLPVVLDFSRRDMIEDDDRAMFLGDGKIRFAHNTAKVGGKILPTLSERLNTAGQYISDVISQYINGFVDVAKDPFIMELGVDMRTAGLYIFMDRLGNDPEHTAYFMNQPMIREYMNLLDEAQISSLQSKPLIKEIAERWGGAVAYRDSETVPNKEKLLKNISHARDNEFDKLDENFRNEQVKIFIEFLKYQAMASDLFALIQGVSWDTAHMSDPELFLLKEEKFKKANSTLFTPASEILNQTFIGNVRTLFNNSRDGIGKFIAIEHPNVRRVLNNLKSRFIDPKFFPSEKGYSKVANRVNNSFLNYVLQVNGKYNTVLDELLKNGLTSTVKQLQDALKILPKDSQFYKILSKFEPMEVSGEGGVLALRFKREGNDVFTRNEYIDTLRAMKQNASLSDLYKKLVRHALVQNGVQLSPNSWSHLIPNDDYAKAVKGVIEALPNMKELDKFNTVGAFFRNAWRSGLLPKTRVTRKMVGEDEYGREYAVPFSFKGTSQGLNKLPGGTVMKSGTLSEYITYSPIDVEGAWGYIPENRDIKDVDARIHKKTAYDKGNPAVTKTYLYQLVRDKLGNPVFVKEENKKGVVYTNYIYRAVNAWGDGNKAQEHYNHARPSTFYNNTFRVTNKTYDERTGELLSETLAEIEPDDILFLMGLSDKPAEKNSVIKTKC